MSCADILVAVGFIAGASGGAGGGAAAGSAGGGSAVGLTGGAAQPIIVRINSAGTMIETGRTL